MTRAVDLAKRAVITTEDLTNIPSGAKNLIINGDMRIDQRNDGESVSLNQFPVDRFRNFSFSVDEIDATLQQVTDAPSGFVNSLKVTITTPETSFTDTEDFAITQYIEGYNIADLGWGTAGAKTVTLSFWTKSSLTGTFGGCIQNQGANRSYPFSYTILSANTWEQKSITIAGDTTGTWRTNNLIGIRVFWSLGHGADKIGTANAWASSNHRGVTGQVQLGETNGATWQITGVQLEVGDTATPFEHRPYDMELARCQRYFWRWKEAKYEAICRDTNVFFSQFNHPVIMRATPSFSHNYTTAISAAAFTADGQLSLYGDGWLGLTGTPNALADHNDKYSSTVYVVGFSASVGKPATVIANVTYYDFSAEL